MSREHHSLDDSALPTPHVPESERARLVEQPALRPELPGKGKVRRFRMRTRILVTLLVMMLVPGYAALLLMWISVTGPIEAKSRDDTFERARALSIELDRQIARLSEDTRELAIGWDFSQKLLTALEQHQLGLIDDEATFTEPLFPRLGSLWNAEFYIVNQRGQIIGKLEENKIRFRFDSPQSIAGSRLLDSLAGGFPAGPFVAEPETQDWNNPVLLTGHIIPETLTTKQACVLVALLPMNPIFESVERNNPYIGQRLIVMSRRDGLMYSTQRDEDMRLMVNRRRDQYFDDDPDADLTLITIRQRALGIGHSIVRTVGQNSSAPEIPEVSWSVLQIVDVEETLALVRPVYWAAMLLGLGMTMIALPLAIIMSGRIVSPILHLTEGVQRYARGELDYRLNIRTGDELELLADKTNEMAESLRATLHDLAARMDEVDEKARQLELIHTISYSVNRVLDLDKVFRRIIKELRVHIPCERISLGLLSEDRSHLVLEHVYPVERDVLPQGTEVPVDGSLMGRALKDQVVSLRLSKPDSRYIEDRTLYPVGMRVLCIVPLIATNGPVGTLNLGASDEQCFTESRIKLLERIADSLALGVEHSRLFDRVARFANELEDQVEKRTAELRAAQAKLVQAEKFAATGAIAAHIGHEVNNPLSIIKNYLKIMTSRIEKGNPEAMDPDKLRENITIISEEIDRIARIITQLRQVSKPEQAVVREIDFHDEMRKLADLFQGTLRKREVELEMDLDPTVRTLVICADHLRQMIINFVRNAMDAMEESGGGIITVRSRPVGEDRFMVEVADTGPGIPEQVISKIFDPFFTTKGEGKGTGLGLAVSYGLAQNMGGTLEAISPPGEGATLRLILPRRANESSPSPENGEESTDDTVSSAQGDAESPPTDSHPIKRRGNKIIIG